MLNGIQFGRGIAAIMVVVYHLSRLYEQSYGQFPFGRFTEVGHIGVDFFFVLSGFIILYAHSSDIEKPKQLRSYLVKRFSRVYPFFWVSICLFLILISVSSSKELPTFSQFFINLTLFPYKEYLVVGVGWTLQHEITFYLLFSTLIINRKLGTVILVSWFISLLYFNFFSSHYPGTPVIFSSFNLQFLMGMAICILSRHNIKSNIIFLTSAIIILISVCALELTGVLNGHSPEARVYYGLSFAFILFAIVNNESHFNKPPKLLLELGQSSYAIYLLHYFFGGILFKLFEVTKVNELLPIWLSAITLLSITVACSHYTSKKIEIPLSKFVRKKLSK